MHHDRNDSFWSWCAINGGDNLERYAAVVTAVLSVVMVVAPQKGLHKALFSYFMSNSVYTWRVITWPDHAV